MLKAVIFDFDGTVADTLGLCIAAFRQAVEPLAGRQVSDAEIVATFGPSEEGTIRALIPRAEAEGTARYLQAYRELHHLAPRPFPGIPELLRELKAHGLAAALVTGKGRKSCELSLDYYGLTGIFDPVETGSPLGPCKVAGIRRTLAALELEPEQALYIGDSPSDLTAAREVGTVAAAAAWAVTADPAALAAERPDGLYRSVAAFRQVLFPGSAGC